MKASLTLASLLLLIFVIPGSADRSDKETLEMLEPRTVRPIDNYQVIRVDGMITFIRTGKLMARGDVFPENEKLKFKTQKSRAAVISKLNGRKILTASESTGKGQLLPAMNNVASRSGAIINAIDLRNHFSGNYLLLSEVSLQINKESFPMDESKFFFIRYDFQGEAINKKLSHEGDVLKIETNELFRIDGTPIDRTKISQMILFYRDGSKNTQVGEFAPVAPMDEDLKAEVEIILAQTSATDKAEKTEEIQSYLTEFYGKVNQEDLSRWLSGHFKL